MEGRKLHDSLPQFGREVFLASGTGVEKGKKNVNVTTGKEDSVREEVFKEGLENRFSHQVVNNRKSYSHVTRNFSDGDLVRGASLSYSKVISYRVLEEDLVRFDKAYVERLLILALSIICKVLLRL